MKKTIVKKIHVNQHVIRNNRKTKKYKPCISVKSGKLNEYAFEVEILGSSKIVYRPNCPLSCGAVIWIETENEVKLLKRLKKTCSIQ